jgi:ABC-type transporter Mla subunit MlaD
MGSAQWLLECALLLLLAATLFHALRLEKALGVLKRDRAVLEGLVEGFNESTRQAESGIERLRSAADGAGRQMARQTDVAQRLRDDLAFLSDRGDRLAERLESSVRAARMMGDGFGYAPAPAAVAALALVPASTQTASFDDAAVAGGAAAGVGAPMLRSQAERDLMRALRAGR